MEDTPQNWPRKTEILEEIEELYNHQIRNTYGPLAIKLLTRRKEEILQAIRAYFSD